MATLAQMRTPLRIMLRCSGVHVACGHSGESFCMFPSFSLLLSFIRRSRSGGSCGRWPVLTGRWMRRRARTEGGARPAASMPVRPCRCGCAGGASRSVLEEGHLEPVAHEDVQAAGYPACVLVEGVHGSPGRLDALAPLVHLLVVDADGAGETCYLLPAPTVQRPDLLTAVSTTPPDVDCAAALDLTDQDPTINQMMASLVLQVVRRMVAGTCPFMGLYLDMEQGAVTPTYATPETVERVARSDALERR